MQQGPIEYTTPTSRAWVGMKRILFQPFEAEKWFLLGFTAWLALLMDQSGGLNYSGPSGGTEEEGGDVFEDAWQWIQANIEIVLTVAVAVGALVLAFLILLLWLSSRGKFMFLDNVVNNRALVAEPWKRFRWVGNSLFRWRTLFLLGTMFVLFGLGGGILWIVVSGLSGEAGTLSGGAIGAIVGMGVAILFVAFLIAYIRMLEENLVIPHMYRTSARVTDAWGKALSLQARSGGSLFLFFLWLIVLQVASSLAVVAVILVTCCIGGILLAIPYLGTVFMLPVFVFFRLVGLEFVRQFGPDFDVWTPVDSPIPMLGGDSY